MIHMICKCSNFSFPLQQQKNLTFRVNQGCIVNVENRIRKLVDGTSVYNVCFEPNHISEFIRPGASTTMERENSFKK